MSKIEQYLTYLNREIVHMAKDPIGGTSFINYADRVVDDVCGVHGLVKAVLGSTKPLAVILGILKGPKGIVIMKFFNEKLHDARSELVMLLSEASRLSNLTGRSNRESYSYLKQLYNSSVKKMIKMVGGKEKNREQINKKYPTLSSLTNFGYSNNGAFNESPFDDDESSSDYEEYADSVLDALRNGEEPPKPFAAMGADDDPLPFDLKVDKSIFQLLDRIQNRIGRKLSPAETLEIIQMASEDDDEDEEPEETSSVTELPIMDPRMIRMMDTIANMVLEKINMAGEIPESDIEIHTNNDLDDFIEQTQESFKLAKPKKKHKNPDPDPNSVSVPIKELGGGGEICAADINGNQNESSSDDEEEEPVMKDVIIVDDTPNNDPIPNTDKLEESKTAELIAMVNGVKPTPQSDDEERQLDPAPPVIETGGEGETDGGLLENIYNTLTHLRSGKVFDQNGYSSALFRQSSEMDEYAQTCGVTVLDNNISITPSKHEGYLIDISVYVVIQEDCDRINTMYVNTINSRMCDRLAKLVDIDPKLMYLTTYVNEIDPPSYMVYASKFLEGPRYNHRLFVENLSTAVAIYLYKVSSQIPDVRYIADVKTKHIDLWVGPRLDSENSPDHSSLTSLRSALSEAEELLMNMLNDEDHSIHLLIPFGWEDGGKDWEGAFQSELMEKVNHEKFAPYVLYLALICQNDLKHLLTLCGIKEENIQGQYQVELSEGPNKVIVEILHHVRYPEGELDVDDSTELVADFEEMYAAGIGMQLLFREISSSIEVESYLTLKGETVEVESEDEGVDSENPPQTNVFGL